MTSDICTTLITDNAKIQCLNDVAFWNSIENGAAISIIIVLVVATLIILFREV